MLAIYVGVFLLSTAILFFELTLTRLFAVTQWYHFAFISVSVALLGFGASGTWLTLHPPHITLTSCQTMQERNRTTLARLAVIAGLFSLSTLLAYLAINYVPFDSYRIAWEPRQLLYLAFYYSALILPFFFAGLGVGLALASYPEQANALYAANLAGSAAGSLLVLALVPSLGGAGAAISASAISMLAAAIFALGAPTKGLLLRSVYPMLFVVLIALSMHPPSLFALHLSPYKTLSVSLLFPQACLISSRWNAFSRVDVLKSAGVHSAPGLSLSFSGELPQQLGLMIDGGNLSPITCIQKPADELFLQYLPTALPYLLRPRARTLILEPRGGLDLLIALHHDASSIVALESNPLVVRAVREQADHCGTTAYDDQRVTVICEEPRSYLRRSAEQFDIVLLSLADAYQPVVSGAYSLSETYTYTVEAFLEYLKHLSEEGIFVVTRWVQSPPSEELRACALLAEALERAGVGDPTERILAFRSWSTATILAKRTPFGSEEIAKLREFCSGRGFDLIYYAGLAVTETNRYNVLPDTAHYDSFRKVLSRNERHNFLRQYPYEVSPPTDDRPFFFHFFKWSQTQSILRDLGKTWQPFGGSGFLILIALLTLAIVLSTMLILLPLAVRSKPAAPNGGFLLCYFACLGLGFLFVEMPLLQQFILFVGQPTYSFSLVLFSVLLFSGLGSFVSAHFPLHRLLIVLIGVILAYPLLLSRLFALSIGWSLPSRSIIAVLSLGPLGFLLGQPLPSGVRLLQQRAPQLIPWAWAINGYASVISSILAVIGAVTFGFSRVLVAGAFAYLLGWIIVISSQSRSMMRARL